MGYINLNGKITNVSKAILPIDNGAFRYGYGLFETLLVEDGDIKLSQYHWERLFAGMKQLYFEIPSLFNEAYLEETVLRTVRKNKLENLCRVRLQVFADGGGLFSPEKNYPRFIIECFPLEPEILGLNENGLIVGIATELKKSIDSLSNLKSCSALIYALAAKQARENKWNDALITNTDGNIIESTIANLFWIKDDTLYTPPLSAGSIAGVMRRYLMERLPVTERLLDLQTLLGADEVFLSNAIRRLKWISNIDKITFKSNQIKHLCIELFS